MGRLHYRLDLRSANSLRGLCGVTDLETNAATKARSSQAANLSMFCCSVQPLKLHSPQSVDKKTPRCGIFLKSHPTRLKTLF